AIVPAPEEGAVLVANPADKMIYYYTEGMAAPMGSFQNYRRDPRALLVLDNSLAETASGVYSTTVRLGEAGHMTLRFCWIRPVWLIASTSPSLRIPLCPGRPGSQSRLSLC